MGDARLSATAHSTEIVDQLYRYITPTPIDFRRLADDLKERGISYSRQAMMLGKEFSSFQRILEGVEPRHADGDAFLRLHATICGPELTALRRVQSIGGFVTQSSA